MSARIRFRQRITKNAQRAHWIVADFRKKNSGDKKHSKKKTSLFREIKTIFFSYVFVLLVFFVALINLFLNRSIFFISSPSLPFLEMCPMFLLFGRPH